MLDLTGHKYNRWTVLGFSHRGPQWNIYWKCKCTCGKYKTVSTGSLRSNNSKSCGCWNIEKLHERHPVTHGMQNTRFYRIWTALKNRCKNPNNKNYGARGIRCHWDFFEKFRDDMYSSYLDFAHEHGEKDTTIERIDVNGDYCLDNCTWKTKHQQLFNKTNSHFISFNGKTFCLSEWADKAGITRACLWRRLYKGWSVEKALTTPVRRKKDADSFAS